MPGNLLIRSAFKQALDIFVEALKTILGCASWEQRDSSNYIDNKYFLSSVFGLKVTVAIADDDEFGQFDFWMCIEAPMDTPNKEFLEGVADCVARKLSFNGYTVVCPFDMGRVGSGAMLYQPNPTKTVGGSDEILIEEINTTNR
jgi:hypothetical protein